MLALDEPPTIVALGGDAATLPDGVGHVPEPAHPPTNLGWTLIGLPRAAARAGVDLIHAPAYTAPWWSPRPVVVTIHDVSYERRPEWYPYQRDALRRAFYRRCARSARHVITDSEFSKAEIQAAYGIPADRITVVPLGVGSGFAAAPPDWPVALPAEVMPPYVLHVGDLHERRNIGIVIEALAEVRRRFGELPALSLVLAGVDRGVREALISLAARLGISDAVVPLGAVDEETLRALYQRADALVYPSLYEGFGLPVLEAMACGTPVIASTAGSIPEVLGSAGVLVDPLDRNGWIEAIARVVSRETVRAELRAAGLRRAREFTWQRTGRLTAAVYRQVVNG